MSDCLVSERRHFCPYDASDLDEEGGPVPHERHRDGDRRSAPGQPAESALQRALSGHVRWRRLESRVRGPARDARFS